MQHKKDAGASCVADKTYSGDQSRRLILQTRHNDTTIAKWRQTPFPEGGSQNQKYHRERQSAATRRDVPLHVQRKPFSGSGGTPRRTQVTLEYDTLSRVVKETDPAGRVTQTQWNGSFAEITRRALDDDHVWKADYNEHGQVIRETDPEGRVTRYGYDEQGLAVSRTDARGGEAALAHDARGQLRRYTDCSGRATGYEYDEDGNLTVVTDAEGKTVRIRYNRLGLPETVNHPGKQQDRYTWNALGLLSSHRRITGSVQSWQYTPRGLLALHVDEEKRETRWHYTAEGWIASLSNGNGALYRFSHDADGRLTGEQRPDGLIRMFVLNAGGYPVIIQTQGTEGGGRNEQQERDALGRLLRSDTQHSTRTFSYNRLDQITEVTLTPTEEGERLHHMQADTVRFAYDRSGWLTAEHSVHGSIKYQRDALGNPTDITLPDGQHLSHLYYGSGHLLQTALDGITVSEYERDSLHRQVMRTQGKLATFSGYNADNRLSWQRSLPGGSQNPQQTGNPPAQNDSVTARDYIWNADGEVGGINDKLRGCLVFSYDRSGWLTSRTGQMYDHDHYYYDKAGNLLTDEYQSAVMDNRLPGYGRDRYRYNEWGELTERRDQQLEWNAQGQLTRVISSNSETRYQYDALGRRISKATSNLHTDRGERSRTTFVWEGVRLLQETTWQGKRTYLYDAEQPYTPVAAITGRGESRKIWYYHTDLTGTVQEVTAADGTLVWAGYQAGFGENRGDISNSGAYFEQPLRLPGQYYDEETGLHYNLFRYYAPECGRFVSQDPISIRGGLNLYRYAPNPITWIDPWGLAKGDYGKMPTFPGWQKHHNIPQNMATHSAIVDSGFDIHNSRNITTLPKTGSIDTARTVHSGMHTGDYDRMVKNALDQIDSLNASPEIKKMHIEALSDDIGNKLRTKQITLNAAC